MLALAVAALHCCGGCGRQTARAREAEPRLLRVFGHPGRHPGEMRMPRAIGFSPDGLRIYVLDRTQRLQVFTPGGEFLAGWETPSGTRGNPRGLDVGADGAIYVADTHNNQVVVYSPEGRERARWGKSGRRPGDLAVVTDVAVSGTRLWTCQYGDYADRVQLFDAAGRFVLESGKFGSRAGELSRPQGLAVDGAGNLYVADSVNHRVQVFSPRGEWLRAWGTLGRQPGRLEYPQDVALDRRGRVYVAEFGNNRISVFTPQGGFLGCWGRPGRGPGDFNMPWGVSVHPKTGEVYVADTANDRVQVFAPLPPEWGRAAGAS